MSDTNMHDYFSECPECAAFEKDVIRLEDAIRLEDVIRLEKEVKRLKRIEAAAKEWAEEILEDTRRFLDILEDE